MHAASLRYQAAARTDVGRRRASNEDACSCAVEHGVFLVADGMGGAAAGEVASSMAVAEVMRGLKSRPDELPLDDAIRLAVATANQVIFSRAREEARYSGMGTTLVGLVTETNRVVVFNVGDSRCYRLREQALTQISQDHSLVEEQVRAGLLSREEAQRSSQRNIITRALGTHADVPPDLFALNVEAGDLFMLCSDGLTNELSDSTITRLLGEDAGCELDTLCDKLVAAANQAGGRDNITCLLVAAEGCEVPQSR